MGGRGATDAVPHPDPPTSGGGRNTRPDPQQGTERLQVPRYASCTFGLPSSSRPLPASTIDPVSIT
jgi:hypothetical protein